MALWIPISSFFMTESSKIKSKLRYTVPLGLGTWKNQNWISKSNSKKITKPFSAYTLKMVPLHEGLIRKRLQLWIWGISCSFFVQRILVRFHSCILGRWAEEKKKMSRTVLRWGHKERHQFSDLYRDYVFTRAKNPSNRITLLSLHFNIS